MDSDASVAIVTGGSSGLGAATVTALRQGGAHVVVLDLQAGVETDVTYIPCDITNDSQVENAIANVVQMHGRIDICVNCAGIGGLGNIATTEGPGDIAQFRRVIDVNLIGAVNVTRFVAHQMIGQSPRGPDDERGLILNTVSIAGFEGQEGMGSYAASKAALSALTLVWTRDLSRHNVRCMAIAPGFFQTPLTEGIPEQMVRELIDGNEFPKRAGRSEEFSNVVMFLVRNPMLNGDIIRIDGGTRTPARTSWAAGN